MLIPRGMHIGHLKHTSWLVFFFHIGVTYIYRLLMNVYVRTCHDASDPVIMC